MGKNYSGASPLPGIIDELYVSDFAADEYLIEQGIRN
jgi:hypothetical protein